jgi:hypothetical protein
MINSNLDHEMIRDLHLSLDNEGEFYKMLVGVYIGAEKQIKKGQYSADKLINAIQSRIAIFLLHGPKHFAYNRAFYPLVGKASRIEVAKQFEAYFTREISVGNSWIRKGE